MRPGAELVPFCVWQLLQLPFVCDDDIARLPFDVCTAAVYGVVIFVFE